MFCGLLNKFPWSAGFGGAVVNPGESPGDLRILRGNAANLLFVFAQHPGVRTFFNQMAKHNHILFRIRVEDPAVSRLIFPKHLFLNGNFIYSMTTPTFGEMYRNHGGHASDL